MSNSSNKFIDVLKMVSRRFRDKSILLNPKIVTSGYTIAYAIYFVSRSMDHIFEWKIFTIRIDQNIVIFLNSAG